MLTAVSIGVGVVSSWRGKAIFTSTGDGVVYGCTAVFDLIYFASSLLRGQLPTPFSIVTSVFQ